MDPRELTHDPKPVECGAAMDEAVERSPAAAAAAPPPPLPGRPGPPGRRSGAASVGAGILLSRLSGLAREQTVAFFFGVGPHADALTAALRVPNALQNLLGEGALSAAFIPIYSRLLEANRREEAGRFAGAIFGLLLATAAGLALCGILLAKPLVALLAPGFLADAGAMAAGRAVVDRFALAVGAVRVLFPMTGCLVLSVWALGVLNSHRRFFLPYFAPVLWNSAMITALLLAGHAAGVWPAASPAGQGAGAAAGHLLAASALRDRLLAAFCWGALAGGLLQFLVQLPLVARVIRGFRFSFSTRVPGVGEALAAWGPVVAGRGVVQIAGYVDLFLATLLATGAAGADRYAQMLYILPISLFGMSVAAAELPELSRLRGEAAAPALLARVRRALGAVAFLNVPTVVGYLAFGYLVVGAVYRRGSFGGADNGLVYLALCGYSTGILATTSSRLLQNTFYALGDTRTPAKIAAQRVGAAALVALPLMFWLDRFPVPPAFGAQPPGQRLFLGVLGLSLASGAGAWLELARLRAALRRRLPAFELPWRDDLRILLLALGAAAPAALLWWLLPPSLSGLVKAVPVLLTYGALYLVAGALAGRPELAEAAARIGFGRGRRRDSL
ncbi:MAG TPA: murein biosynthesis integral membrane protein MurJ [Thermoanaerobaculia bacterium]|jgi:putative peptidoglycan lipid II flippase|nr:murein biosynthesis integral membrane protein MurJ [Thermoanaerobaculia bacterium]